MPGVTKVEVSGSPEPMKENGIELVVHGNVDEDAVKEWCQEQLASYKQPTRVTLIH